MCLYDLKDPSGWGKSETKSTINKYMVKNKEQTRRLESTWSLFSHSLS